MPFRLFTTPIVCTAFCLQSYAQAPAGAMPLRVRFTPILNGKALSVSDQVPGNAEALHITTLRCYISRVSLFLGEQEVWHEADSYHLIDAETPESLTMSLQLPAGLTYNAIHFSLGVDSATSSSGAHGGDLDPAKGMYWAWQSGYINFKLEGISPQSSARKHQFQFHLGGYLSPYTTQQPVALQVKPADELLIKMDLTRFLSGLDLSKLNSVMIPGEAAVMLSRKAAGIFYTGAIPK